jgi:hypothetical protein
MPAPTIHKLELPLELQLRRRITVKQAAELKCLSEDAFRKHFILVISSSRPRQADKRSDSEMCWPIEKDFAPARRRSAPRTYESMRAA